MMLVSQSRRHRHALETKTLLELQKEHPWAMGNSVARETVTRHGRSRGSLPPHPSLVGCPLDGCHEWRVFKYLIFPVCLGKKGPGLCKCISKAKLGEDWEVGEHVQRAMLQMRREWSWGIVGHEVGPASAHPSDPLTSSWISSKDDPEDKEASMIWLLLTLFYGGLTMCQLLHQLFAHSILLISTLTPCKTWSSPLTRQGCWASGRFQNLLNVDALYFEGVGFRTLVCLRYLFLGSLLGLEITKI